MKHASLPKTWIFFFVIIMILIVGAMLESAVEKSHSIPVHASETAVAMTDRQKNAEAMTAKGGNTVYVEDQKAGSSKVIVGFVVFADSGFVAIHEDDNGVPGPAIGASALIHGRADRLTINTTASLQKDRVYYAVLHRDNGDGKFNATDDGFLNDSESGVTLMSFLAKE